MSEAPGSDPYGIQPDSPYESGAGHFPADASFPPVPPPLTPPQAYGYGQAQGPGYAPPHPAYPPHAPGQWPPQPHDQAQGQAHYQGQYQGQVQAPPYYPPPQAPGYPPHPPSGYPPQNAGPYAAAYGQKYTPPPGPMIWRERKVLVLPDGWNLPDRCIKCNQPSGREPIKRKLYWHSPWLFVLVLVSLLVYLIVALVVRKNATVHFAVCERHRFWHWVNGIISTTVCLIGVAVIIAAIAGQSGGAGVLGAVLLVGGLIYVATAVPYVKPKKIENKMVWLLGCRPEFLEPFMEWPPR